MKCELFLEAELSEIHYFFFSTYGKEEVSALQNGTEQYFDLLLIENYRLGFITGLKNRNQAG